MKRIHFIVRGSAQGVGFRYFCQVQAARLGLTGFAQNKNDGSVKVEAQGDAASLEAFDIEIRNGPRRATVTSIEREEIPSILGEGRFDVR